jgi:hypothetical protein
VLRSASRFFSRQFVVHLDISDCQFAIADFNSGLGLPNWHSAIDNRK